MVSVEFLRECFDYDPETGVLRWKQRPLSHFENERGWAVFNARFPGSIVSGFEQEGYVRVEVRDNKKKKRVWAHHIAWALTTGEWPKNYLDHRNGVRSDNRLCNLREATRGENGQNLKTRIDNTSGATGVTWCKQANAWHAQLGLKRIGATRNQIHLGYFDSLDDARAAYLAAKASLHPFQPIPRELTEA